MPLDWLKSVWDKENSEFKHVFLSGDIPENCKELRFYIWNMEKETITLENSKVKLYTLRE